MNNNRLQSLYYWFTFLLCACAGLSAASLIGKLYLSIFLLICGLGIYFSSQATIDTKINLRNIFGGILLIGLPIFFWKISLQQSTLPHLVQVFLLLIIFSCYIIENASTLSLVHFECIFITIFSACLPFIIHPRYQVSLFGLSLFLIVVLLQITQIRYSADLQVNQYIITNVSVKRRFILSFVISLLIAGIGSLVFFIVPKYSFQLDLDWRGSSFVDFKLKPKSNLRLMLPYEGGEKELSQSEVVPYVRSLFVKQEQDKNLMSFESNKWKQPLIIKEKDKEKVINSSVKEGNNKQGLVSEGNNISEEDKQEVILTKTLDNPNAQLKTKIKNLETKIAKDKKLYDFLSFMGSDDPIQVGQLNKIAKTINQDKLKLSRLKNDLNQNKGQSADQEQLDQQGLGNIGLLAKSTNFGKNKDDKKENNDGNDLGKQGEAGKGTGNDGIGVGEDGTGEGEGKGPQGIGKSLGKGEAGINESDFAGEDKGEIEAEQGNIQGQKDNSQVQINDNKLGESDSKNKTADDQQSEVSSSEDPAGTSQNKNNKGSESDQPSEKSEQLNNSENKSEADKTISSEKIEKNNRSEQEKVNDQKGNLPGMGSGTNSAGDIKGESQGGDAGGETSGKGSTSESLGEGEGKGNNEKSGSFSGSGDGAEGSEGDSSGGDGAGSGKALSETAGSSDTPGGKEGDKEKLAKDSENTTVISYLFKFKNKPLSLFREQVAEIARGSVPRKADNLSAESKHYKQENFKDAKENKQKKSEEIAIVKPEILTKEKISEANSDFFWYMFVFFAVLFCGGICWFFLGIVFCIIRKILLYFKLVYILMFKIDKIIVYLYRNFLFLLKKIGVRSHEFLTPKEIGDIAVKKYNLSQEAIDSITEVFEQSRYSNHQINEKEIISCIKAYNQLKIDIIKDNTFLRKIGLKLDMLSIKSWRKS